MGSSNSKKKKLNVKLEEDYIEIGLPKISNEDFKNELEKEIYIAINMIRYNPTKMAELLKPLKTMDELSKTGKKSVDTVKKMLKKREACAPLALYNDGSKACEEVNKKFFSDEEEYKGNKENIVIDANADIIKTLEASKKGKMEVKGDTAIITDISDQTGALVILADICEWVGSGKSDFPHYLQNKNKKIGLNIHAVNDKVQVLSMVLIEDFMNSMI